MCAAIRTARAYGFAANWTLNTVASTGQSAAIFANDAALEVFLKSNYGNQQHDVGTCRLSQTAATGVVNGNFQVHGTSNLRVVDISTLPFGSDGNTGFIAYVVGNKAFSSIKQSYFAQYPTAYAQYLADYASNAHLLY
jgi:choline dehydrogenase-like flavoprotein